MFYFFNHINFGQSCQYSYLFFLKFQNLSIHVPVQPALSSRQDNNLPTLVPINLKKATGHSDRHVQLQKNCLFV